ncbi:MAG: VUT family protein [archaeon]
MVRAVVLVLSYIVSIICANLLILKFGPAASIITAFFLIGLDLTLRDSLHEKWHQRNLYLKMMLLIISGSILSYLINQQTAQIAIASFVAFFFAGFVDFVVYSKLFKKKWIIKTNGSNIASSLVDSIVFPTLAFGTLLPWIILGQFIAKSLGGFVWSLVLGRFRYEYYL